MSPVATPLSHPGPGVGSSCRPSLALVDSLARLSLDPLDSVVPPDVELVTEFPSSLLIPSSGSSSPVVASTSRSPVDSS